MLLGAAIAGLACAWLAGGRPLRLADGRHPSRSGAAPHHGGVTVVIPARDEAATLPSLLSSIAGSEVRPASVVVVDDGSTDATADIALGSGAEVVVAGDPPPGWTGKCWACRRGADASPGDLLLFLDADVKLAPEAIGTLLAVHADAGGLVSVQPHHTPHHAYEELSALCNAVAVLGSGAASPIGSWRRASAAGFGPCMLTTRADYELAGGHDAVRGEVTEDLALAARYRAAGLPTTALLGGELVRYRMYPGGLGQLVDGWTKNLAVGAATASRPAVIATTLWIASLAAVTTGAVGGLTGVLRTGAVPWAAISAATIAAAGVRRATATVGDFRRATAAAFPVPLAVFVGIFARSTARVATGRPVRWRGREVATTRRAGGHQVDGSVGR